tara:strand:+ start:499 stop:717 length:219 start_codon:yes stop_codon:yes gene_type:complete
MSEQEYILNDDFIELSQLLKVSNLVSSGGEAKLFINDGKVKVNGIIETRKKKKLYNGDQIQFQETTIKLIKN